MTPPKKRDKVKVKKVKAWAVCYGKSGGLIEAYPTRSDAIEVKKIHQDNMPVLKLKVIPCTITYKSGNGR